MSDQPSTPPAPTQPPVANLNVAPPLSAQPTTQREEPKTQGKVGFRKRLPIWLQEMPQFGTFQPPQPDPEYQLIDREDLEEVIQTLPQAAKDEIVNDMQFMNYELMRLFRQRDHEAKRQQNRYRRVQLLYLMLAALATMIGAVQAISFNSNPETMPVYAFLETIVALLAAFLATISGREPPMQLWLQNRRRAEQLRREYFRYLTRMPPYDQVVGYQRQMLLSKRAADINRGVYPQEIDPRAGTGEKG